MTLAIRRANPKDRDAILAFHYALYVEHRKTLVPPDLAPLGAYRDLGTVLREDVDALLQRPQAVVLVAECEGQLVGYATGHVENDPRRELARKGVIEDWYVEVDRRGQGIGRALFESLLEVFRQRDCLVAESKTWPTNTPARKAHEKAGFHEVEITFRRALAPSADPRNAR